MTIPTILRKVTVLIGSRFTGKTTIYVNYGTGEYQHSLPPVDVQLQQALLKK